MRLPDKTIDSILLWIILVGGLIVGLFSLITWPFRAIARRLPGRREKLLQSAIDELRSDVAAARQLLRVLANDNPKSAASLEKAIQKTEHKLAEVESRKGWPEDLEGDGPGVLAIELLVDAGVANGMDWRSSPEDLQECLAIPFKRRGISLDWGFVKEIEAARDWEALRNARFLPVVGDQVQKLGFVLAQIVEGSDAYYFAICTPEQFAQVDGLSCRSFTIRRLSTATGLAVES